MEEGIIGDRFEYYSHLLTKRVESYAKIYCKAIEGKRREIWRGYDDKEIDAFNKEFQRHLLERENEGHEDFTVLSFRLTTYIYYAEECKKEKKKPKMGELLERIGAASRGLLS